MASDSYDQYIAEIKKRTVFEILGFDEAACIELVDMSLSLGKPKRRTPEDTWAKLKYDRQIIAIAKAGRARRVYTTDDGVRALALEVGLVPVDLEELPAPPPKQITLKLVEPARVPVAESATADAAIASAGDAKHIADQTKSASPLPPPATPEENRNP
jgi:hypothetical protein